MIVSPLRAVCLFTINIELIEPALHTLTGGEFIIVALTLSQHPTVRDSLENINMRLVH